MKISVVIPIYNVESYLHRCLESVVNQSYSDLEIILVNDGSTDNSLSIINKFAQRDKRIIVFSQENSGKAVARNVGLRAATGKYISFIDSDDWIEKDMYSELAVHLEKEHPDFVNFRFQFDNETLGTHSVYGAPYKKLKFESQDEILEDALKNANILTAPWMKIYDRNFLLRYHLSFEPGIVNEDTLFAILISCHARKVTFVNQIFYHAIEREGSTSRSSQQRLFLDMHTALQKAKEHMIQMGCFERFHSLYEARYLKSMLYNQLQAAQRLPYPEYVRVMNICLEQTLYKEYNHAAARKYLPLPHQIMLILGKSLPCCYAIVGLLNKIGWRMH